MAEKKNSIFGRGLDTVEKLLYPRPQEPDRSAPPVDAWWPGPNPIDRNTIQVGETFDKTTIAGLLSQAAAGELWRFSAFKTEMRASNAHLDGEIRKVESYITQAPFEINPPPQYSKTSAKDTADGKAAHEIADYVREQILDPDVNIKEVIRHYLWGLMDIVSGVQVLVDPGGAAKGREKLVSLTPIPSMRFNYISGTTILAVTPGDDPHQRVPVSDYGAGLAVILADPHVPSPARRGVLRRCLTPWLAHRYGQEWWGRAVELFGIPFRKGIYPASNEGLRQKLEAAMRNQGTAAYGAFPEGTDIEVIAQGLGAASGHQEFLFFMESAMSKAILGSTQTSQIERGAGSKASSVVHQDVMEVFVESYGNQICAAIREGIIRPLVMRNFGEEAADLLCPRVSLNIKGYEDLSMFATAVQTLVATGVPVPEAWVLGRAGIPAAEDDEPVLSGQTAAEAQAAKDAAAAQPATGFKKPGEQGTQPLPNKPGTPNKPGAKPGKVLPFGKKAQMTAAEFRAALSSPGETLAALEAGHDERAVGSGEPIVGRYMALIDEAHKSGGDLGHLAARVRLLARQENRSVAETAALIEAVLSEAMLSGLADAGKA